jgi:hypothetical protein
MEVYLPYIDKIKQKRKRRAGKDSSAFRSPGKKMAMPCDGTSSISLPYKVKSIVMRLISQSCRCYTTFTAQS